jgi:small subunit ribosomal protein S19e
MTTVKDVPVAKLIDATKEKLKTVESVKPPEWMKFAKSGAHAYRPPEQQDFWYIRAASILRKIYLEGPVGTARLRTFYGGRKRRGYKPAHFKRGSGNIVRKILMQLESAGFVVKTPHGRKISPKGQKFLDNTAFEASKR